MYWLFEGNGSKTVKMSFKHVEGTHKQQSKDVYTASLHRHFGEVFARGLIFKSSRPSQIQSKCI